MNRFPNRPPYNLIVSVPEPRTKELFVLTLPYKNVPVPISPILNPNGAVSVQAVEELILGTLIIVFDSYLFDF